jgi:hypothetical protein
MSHDRIPIDSELSAIEAALQSLLPAESRIDRDLVMFQAGQAVVRRAAGKGRGWIVSTAVLGLFALTEAFLLASRPAPRVIERVVAVREAASAPVEAPLPPAVAAAPTREAPGPPNVATALGRTAYERLLEQVLRYGLDGLPAPAATAWTSSEPKSAASRQSLQEELRRALELGDHS